VNRFAAAIRPDNAPTPFEVRFETPAGKQAQVDFARFVTIFTDEPVPPLKLARRAYHAILHRT
jgi:hypothetical protein